MFDISLPIVATWLSATVFAAVGAMNLTGVRAARRLFERLDIPTVTYRIIGAIDLITALLLADPNMRAWGIVLAAPIAFGAVVFLLEHRLYACATVPTLILVALVPAMLAVPRDDLRPHYANPPVTLHDSRR